MISCADLINSAEYDFDRDCEIAHQSGAFFAYGSVLHDRIIHQSQTYTTLQLVHRLIYTMKTNGLVLRGPTHKKTITAHMKKKKDTNDTIDIHAFVAKHSTGYTEATDGDSDGGWFGWCTGGRN
jgi:hypothetical protein